MLECPVYPTFKYDSVPDGCTIVWFTDRDDADTPNYDVAECGTVTPIAEQAYGTDMRYTPASSENPDVSVTYFYGNS